MSTALRLVDPDDGWQPDRPVLGDLLTSVELMALTGCTYRQLDYWCRVGYLRPAVPGAGSGTQRLWDWGEADVVDRMVRLVAAGLSVAAAAGAARHPGEAWLSDTVRVVFRP